MGWLGKVIGGTLGFAIGGPLGAIAGTVFGHGFDKSEQRRFSDEDSALSHSEESQFTFFVASFSMLAKLTRADGHVSKEELNSIETFMTRDLGLNAASRQVAIEIFNTATRSRETFEDYARQFYQAFRAQPQIIELMVDILLRVAVADGRMSADEERLILSAVHIFNFGDGAYHRLKARYVREDNRYYAVLKCDESDSNETVKRQYRRLVSEYHPDKIASKGLPEEFTKFAADKFREIQEAYDNIRQQRGLK